MANLSPVIPAFGKNIVAASQLSELGEAIPYTSLALPEYSMMTAENERVFEHLLSLSDHERQVPVVVKVLQDRMLIASVRTIWPFGFSS